MAAAAPRISIVSFPNGPPVLVARSFASVRDLAAAIVVAVPVHLRPAHAGPPPPQDSLPVAERAAAEVLSLPMGPHLFEDDQHRVVAALVDAVG